MNIVLVIIISIITAIVKRKNRKKVTVNEYEIVETKEKGSIAGAIVGCIKYLAVMAFIVMLVVIVGFFALLVC